MKKFSAGALSAPRYSMEPGYCIDDALGEPVFWGRTNGETLLAVDYDKFMGWLRERGWALMWWWLSERRAMRSFEYTAVESHQSSIVVLQPGHTPREFTAKRKDWCNDKLGAHL